MDPEQLNSLLQEASQLHQAHNFKEAEQKYREILSANPNWVQILPSLSDTLFAQGRPEEALRVLEEGRTNFPGNETLLNALCGMLNHLSRLNEAVEVAREAASLFPDSLHSNYNLGLLLYHNRAYAEAQPVLKKVIELDPKLPGGHFSLGHLYYSTGKLGEAEASYQRTTELEPENRDAWLNLGGVLSDRAKFREALAAAQQAARIDPTNALVLQRIGMAYHGLGEADQAEVYFRKILESVPEDKETLNLLANVLRDQNRKEEALSLYRKVLSLDPENQIARDNLDRYQRNMIQGWHFEMLADEARNRGFQEAIRRQVKKGDLVLDIGSGSGLLAMIALEAGAEQVVACEMNPDLAEVGLKVLRTNKMDDRIQLYPLKSNSLWIGEHLPRQADVLVAEILDAGLIGEGVLPSLRHAQANLLSPEARLVPQAAQVKGMLIAAPRLKKINPVGDICGFDLSGFNHFRAGNTYSQCSLAEEPHQGLTEVFPIWEVDFRDIPGPVAEDRPVWHEVKVKVRESGLLDAVAFWFDLNLDEALTLSSGPKGQMKHWGQAIFFFEESRAVQAGEEITLQVGRTDMSFRFREKPMED